MFSDRGEAFDRRLYPHLIVTAATLALAAGLVVLASGAEAQSGGRIAQCRVQSGDEVHVNGPCRFSAEKGGSFALENSNRSKPLFDGILMVSVTIVSPGVAEVRGLTQSGNNSRWGPARRSKRDGACWEGADFRICAR